MAEYYNTNREVLSAFEQGRAGVENKTGTMETRELEDGSVELVGYGWQRYAINEDGNVTVFAGWAEWANEQSSDAEATPRHIRNAVEIADNVVNRTPQVAPAPRSVQRIGHVGRQS
jgi:hypothetical protein